MARSKRKPKAAERPAQATQGRAFWSGTITFGLVSVPVDFFSANRSRNAPLRLLTAEGHPVGRRYRCPVHERAIERDEIVRGYELDSGRFVVVTDEELASVAPEKTRDIDLKQFVSQNELPPLLFQRAYYLAPGGSSTKAYDLLVQTMERTKKAGIASFVMRDKAYVVAILARGGLLRAETLRFPGELRTPETLNLPQAPEKIPKRRVAELGKAIDALRQKTVDHEELVDDGVRKLEALAQSKYERGEDVVEVAGEESDADQAEAPIDLVQLLKQRLEGAPPARKAARPSTSKGTLERRSKSELYERAKKLGIEGRSQMNKDDLAHAIRRATG